MDRIQQLKTPATRPRTPVARSIAGAQLLVAVLACATYAAQPPNIIFIMSDDHAYQAISAYGSQWNHTPNIDRIANEGVRFDRCYVANSICAPSRASILTGKYSHVNGVLDNYTEFDGGQWTFPKSLQRAGYQTAMIGKWHLKSDPTGFDHWDILVGQGYYYRPKFKSPAGVRQVDGYVTDLTTDLAMDWLQGKTQDDSAQGARNPDQPFLLMLQHKAPHRPWDPAPRHLRAYEDKDFAEPETLFDDYATRTTAPRTAEMRISQMRLEQDLKVWPKDNKHRVWLYKHMTPNELAAWNKVIDPRLAEFNGANLQGKARTRWMWRHYLEDYLACVKGVDESVGRVLDWLDESGLAENTIVIYTSDQGFYLGEHGWFDKRFMYEQSLRTPMVVRWPNGDIRGQAAANQPRVENRIVANLDIGPTLLELANANVDPTADGRSFVPLLKGQEVTDWRELFYYHYHEGPERDHAVERHDGVTNGTHKLIHFYEVAPHDGGEWELYDLQSDPAELVNRYNDPQYATVRKDLTAALVRERSRLGVKVPTSAARSSEDN